MEAEGGGPAVAGGTWGTVSGDSRDGVGDCVDAADALIAEVRKDEVSGGVDRDSVVDVDGGRGGGAAVAAIDEHGVSGDGVDGAGDEDAEGAGGPGIQPGDSEDCVVRVQQDDGAAAVAGRGRLEGHFYGASLADGVGCTGGAGPAGGVGEVSAVAALSADFDGVHGSGMGDGDGDRLRGSGCGDRSATAELIEGLSLCGRPGSNTKDEQQEADGEASKPGGVRTERRHRSGYL